MTLKHNGILIWMVFLLVNQTQAQHKNDFEAGLFNIGFGGIIGGIGAVINKKPRQKTGKVFLKGLYQGALGGYLLFESKRLVGKFSETGNYSYIWPSKLVNSAGVSIIENAAANRNLWEQWHINFGFNRFEFYTKDKFKISYRVMPFALYKTIEGFTNGKLNFSESFKIGSFVFTTSKINSGFTSGRALTNSILILNNLGLKKESTLAHELIHVYQYESFSGMNPFLNVPIAKLNINQKWVKTYHKIFYTDFNYLSSQGIYSTYKNHDTNFFEKEARYYSFFR